MTKTINRLSDIAEFYIEKIADELQSIFTEDLGLLINAHKNYNDAFRGLSLFLVRVLKLSKGILSLVVKDNLYSAQALLRCLVEHSFKVEFLINRSLIEANDNIYKEYFLFCDLAEELQYQKSLDFKAQKLEEAEIDEGAYQELIKRKPELKKYSKSQINEKANQFTFRNIFRFLNQGKDKNVSLGDDLKPYYGAYLHTGAIYSDLSSFVHGGPFAEKFEFRIYLDDDEHNEEILDIVENVMVMHFATCLAICSFFSKLDKKYEDNIKKIVAHQMEYYNKI